MERRKSEAIGDVLQRFLRQEGLETPLAQYRLIQAWPQVTGKAVAEATTELYIKNQTLYARLTSAVLRSELMMQRQALAYALNQYVQAQVITDVVLM